MILGLEPWQLLLGWLGAFFVGLGKGGLPGMGNLTIAIYALVFPAKDSVGILLPVLISADVLAVIIYRRHAHWRSLRRLIPWAALGVILGYFAMDLLDNAEVRRFIGGLLLFMTALHFVREWTIARAEEDHVDPLPHSRWFAASTGIVGGFATMMANAAGPVAALYLLVMRLPKLEFIGTTAWFFLVINLFKVPFQIDVGIINGSSILISIVMMAPAIIGAAVAPFLVKYIKQRLFETLIWIFVVIAGVEFLFGVSFALTLVR